MDKQLARYLAIEEVLQKEIKDTLEHSNQLYGEWCSQNEKRKTENIFYLNLYESKNDMKHFRTVCITPQPYHSHFIVDCCKFGPSWIFGLKLELMPCAGLVGGKREQNYLLTDLI